MSNTSEVDSSDGGTNFSDQDVVASPRKFPFAMLCTETYINLKKLQCGFKNNSCLDKELHSTSREFVIPLFYCVTKTKPLVKSV